MSRESDRLLATKAEQSDSKIRKVRELREGRGGKIQQSKQKTLGKSILG